MATSSSSIVGIDLGTTLSSVAVYDKGKVHIVDIDESRMMPSYVAFTSKERLVGMSAKERLPLDPANTIFDMKRLIGRKTSDSAVVKDREKWPFKVIDEAGNPRVEVVFHGKPRRFAPEQISAMVLEKLKMAAEEYLCKEVTKAVITIPAYFSEPQRQATLDAAKIANIEVIQLLHEPTAAAIAYGLDKAIKNKKVLVFDLGGGTFDVTILHIHDNRYEVKATCGNMHLGGEDFDSNLLEFCVEDFKRKTGIYIGEDQSALGSLKFAVEDVKKQLSNKVTAPIEMKSLYKGKDYHSIISRTRFEELNRHLFEQAVDKVVEALEFADYTKHDIDDVVLVGGSTRIPKVQQMISEFFEGKKLKQIVHPGEAVAQGAALYAYSKSDYKDGGPQDLVLWDVTPLSLGTAVTGSIMDVIIKRNTPIPVTMKKKYSTTNDQQTSIHFTIYEGERQLTKDNVLLGDFWMTELPRGPPRATRFEATYELDVNGLLYVSACVLETGKAKSLVVRNNKGRLSSEEIHKMIKEAEDFRAADEVEKERVAIKNKLQNLCLNIRSFARRGLFAGDSSHYVVEQSEDAMDWLQENENYPKEAYQRQYRKLQESSEKAGLKHEDY